MKKYFILLLWFAVASQSYAQDEAVLNQPLLNYFQNMDMSQVNTGIPRWHHLFHLAIKSPRSNRSPDRFILSVRL